jgi:hypothetical protein
VGDLVDLAAGLNTKFWTSGYTRACHRHFLFPVPNFRTFFTACSPPPGYLLLRARFRTCRRASALTRWAPSFRRCCATSTASAATASTAATTRRSSTTSTCFTTRRVEFLHARTPTHSPPDVKTGRSTPRSLYTLLNLCMSLFCLLRVLIFALGGVLT